MNSLASHSETTSPSVCLVGAGVVGTAIAKAHVDAGVSMSIADQCEEALRKAIDSLKLKDGDWSVSPVTQLGGQLPVIHLISVDDSFQSPTPIVIESIAERLDVKRSFFSTAEQIFGDQAILCSNTSTLRIGAIAENMVRPGRFCGMHFFMPVDQRLAVELIRGDQTSNVTIDACGDHVKRIHKEPLAVGDGPGFIVNRLLSPYLNEAMLMLGRGVTAEQIEQAALAYGMPMSPLELIDLIGARTMFDAGRVYWQSFPKRINPSPMLSALIKQKRLGKASGLGLYDYRAGQRSQELSPVAMGFCERYRHNVMPHADQDVMHLLSIPMWIEAALALRDGIAQSVDQFDLAMRGGLGFGGDVPWDQYFQSLGSDTIIEQIDRWSTVTASMRPPAKLLDLLQRCDPSTALLTFAAERAEL